MKKVLFTLFVIALALACVLALPNRAEAAELNGGPCGENATWSVDDNGTLTITGTGEITMQWYVSGYNIDTVIISDGITNIPNSAFTDCTTLTSVYIGNTVEVIGEYAFQNCTGLATITIPESVKKIDHFAFQNCNSLVTVNGCANLEYIGTQAFLEVAVEEFPFSDSLTYIGESAFFCCRQLKSAILPDGVKLDNYIFTQCESLATVRLPEDLTELPRATFNNCYSLESIVLPESITRIAADSLSGCKSLKEIIFGDNVTVIEEGAFAYCHKLSRVSLPAGLVSIGGSVFNSLYDLDVLYFRGTAEQWANVAIGDYNYDLPETEYMYFAAPDNLASIVVSQKPKYIYYVGEELDLTGLCFTGTCADGATVELIDMHVTNVSAVDMTTVGKKTVTVYIGSISTSFDIGVHSGGPQAVSPEQFPSIISAGGTYVVDQAFSYPGARELTVTFSSDSFVPSSSYGYIGDYNDNRTYLYNRDPSESDYFPGKTYTISGNTIRLGIDRAIDASRLTFSSIYATVIDHDIVGDHCSICGAPDPTRFIDGGNLGSNIQWTLSNDGTLTFSGNGAIPDFELDQYYNSPAPWSKYSYSSNAYFDIVIGDGITYIGDNAIYNFRINSLTVPESLTGIGEYGVHPIELWEVNYSGTRAQLDAIENGGVLYNYVIPNCKRATGITEVSINCHPKTDYIVGEELDLSGLLLNIYCGEEYCETGGVAYVDEVSDVDMSTPGIKEVTLYVGDFEVEFPIYVHNGEYTTLDPSTYPESAHNYANDTDDTQTFTYEGATELTITFSNDTLLERGFDTLEIYDKDGNYINLPAKLAGYTMTLPGDSFSIRLITNDVVVSYGYSFSSIVAKVNEHTMQNGHCAVCGYYNPDDFVASGQCGDNAHWTIDSDGTLVIFGYGEMWFWPGYKNHTYTKAIVEDGITHLGDSAFSDNNQLTSVSLPDTLTHIGNNAFGYCSGLTEITIPDSVTYMDPYVFHYCTSLATVTFGSGIKELPYGTFSECTGLKNVTLPDGLTYIGDEAFRWCTALESITIPDNVTEIDMYAFAQCYALKTIDFGDSVTVINEYAFHGCSSITSVDLPDGVFTLGAGAFESCHAMTTISLPASLTTVGSSAFSSCGNLKTVIYRGSEASWQKIDIAFGNYELTSATLYYSAPENISLLFVLNMPTKTAYVIGEELDLSGLTLRAVCDDESVTILTDWHVTDVEVDMSKAGKAVATVYVGDVCTTFEFGIHEGSSVILDKDTYPESQHPYIQENEMQTITHAGASELLLTFGEGSVTESSYDYVVITDKYGKEIARLTGELAGKVVTVPGDTANITISCDDSVFNYGYIFSSIEARTITHIYEEGFCTICGGFDPSIYIDMGEFNAIKWVLKTDGTLTISGTGDITSAPWLNYHESVTSVVIESGITAIGASAFDGCNNLVSVTIPSSVTQIGDFAFANCANLPGVEIPATVTRIGDSAFRGCSSITKMDIPDSVTELVYGAFRDCTNLQTVTLPSSLNVIDSTLFMNCGSLEEIDLPTSLNRIEWAAFQGCSSLTTVDIPGNVYTIGEDAFRDCAKLTTVNFIAVPQYIFRSTFEGCVSLEFNEYDNGLYLGDWASKYSLFYAMKDDQSTTCTVHDDTTVIAGSAFSRSMLTSIKLPDGVTSINPKAFHDCFYLTDIYIPDNVNYIGRSAFSGCERLKSITLPSRITTIYEWTFYNCSALQTVTIPGNVHSIGGYAFNLCEGLQEVIIKSGVSTIDYDAFSQCYSLKRVVLPLSVDYIGYSAFYDCGALTSVVYAGTEAQREDIFSEGENYELFELPTWYYGCDENSSATVTFKVGDTVISSKTYAIGDTIVVPDNPTKASDNTYSYSFTGWDKEISTTCQGDVTYKATFKATKRTYTVTFKNEDGSVISKKTYNYGATITVPANPTKASTNTYKYTFAGWGKTVSKTCTGNATYTASFTATKRTYTVTFKDADGTTISSKSYNYGATITVPANPTKASTNTYKYTFNGWDKTVSKTCKGSVTYTATYSSVKRTYTVTFKDADGTTISSKSYNYGATITVPANPTKASTNTYKYTFSGWDNDVSKTCKGSATYTATYKATKRTYTVTFKNPDGTVISSKGYTHGATVTAPKATMTSSSYVYTFTGWNKKVATTCKGAATYTAEYSTKLHTPDVDGSNNSSGKPVLKWDKVKNAAKYEVYRATSKSGTYKKIATTTSTSYTDKSATTGKTYYYKVRAVSSKSSVDKSAFCDVIKLSTKLKTPTIKVTHKQNDKQNVIKWSKISGAKKYVLQVSVNGGSYKTLTTTTKTSYTHKKIVGGRTYTYRLIAKASSTAYDSAYSKTVKVTAKCARPNVTVKLNSSDKPVLKWNEVAGAEKYQIYVATSKNGTYKLLTTTTKETYTHKKATDGKTYYYKVRAVDSKGVKGSFSAIDRIAVK